MGTGWVTGLDDAPSCLDGYMRESLTVVSRHQPVLLALAESGELGAVLAMLEAFKVRTMLLLLLLMLMLRVLPLLLLLVLLALTSRLHRLPRPRPTPLSTPSSWPT